TITTPKVIATSSTAFTVIKPSTITAFTPLSGAVGAVITITGTNLSSVIDVEFNGVSAGAPTVVSATSIKATVPVGATSGKISLTSPAGTAASTAVFKVLPKITGFTPSSGLAGESVKMNGTSLKLSHQN